MSSACGVGMDLAMDEAGFVVVSGVDTRCPKVMPFPQQRMRGRNLL